MLLRKRSICPSTLSPSASHARSTCLSAMFRASMPARFTRAESMASASSVWLYRFTPANVRNDSLFFAAAVFLYLLCSNR